MTRLYPYIFKRRSVRKYNNELEISKEELKLIKDKIAEVVPLFPEIKTEIVLAPVDKSTLKKGSHCILLYSEKEEGYTVNAGYMLEQLDLYLCSLNIGVCWYGLAKAKEKERNGLPYVIMLGLGKSEPEDFRSDIKDFNRKDISEIWQGEFSERVKTASSLAPSACNSQPWIVKSSNEKIEVFRNTEPKTIIPKSHRPFFGGIDCGIYIFFLELALTANNFCFERSLYKNEAEENGLQKLAQYDMYDMFI